MTFEEERYAGTTLRIAMTMLLFLLLTLVRGFVITLLPLWTGALSAVGAEILEELLDDALYALCFLLPAWSFARWPMGTPAVAIDLTPNMPRNSLSYVFFGMAVTGAMVFFNAQIVNIFHYKEFSNEVLWKNDVAANYQIFLTLVGMAVIPAFVEELLFRGVILANLLPYGKGTAILGSAVLFGLMHQNAEQWLYATAAGAVLGWIFVQTRSIWPCILMHFLNNFRSTFQTVLLSRVPSATTEMALYLLYGVLLALGLLSGVRLFCAHTEHQGEPRGDEACSTLSPLRRVRLFFNLPMIIFVAWSVVNMLILILAALGILR